MNLDREGMKNLVSKNISLRLASKVLYLFTRIFLPPLTLHYVSLEEYGIWAACFIFVSYLGMSAFGISNVYVRYVAEYRAKQETEKINRLLSTGLTVMVSLSLALLSLLWLILPFVIRCFHIQPSLHRTAFVLMFMTAATFMLDLSFGAFAYVLHGLQEVAEQTVVWIISFCIEAALIVILLIHGLGIYSLAWAFVIRYVFSTAAYVVLCYRALPDLSLSPRYFDGNSVKLFFGYGAIVQISGLLGTFLYSIEKVIAGFYIGIRATGLFDIGEKFPVMASQMPESISSVLLPALSHMHTVDWKDEMKKLYVKACRYMNMLTGVLMGFLVAFALPIIVTWVGAEEKYRASASILSIFALAYQLNTLTGPASAFHRGVAKPTRELVYPLAQLVLVVLTVSVGFAFFGRKVLVIAVAVSASMILSALIYLAYSNKLFEVSQRQFATKVLAPGMFPYLVGFINRWASQPLLVWAGPHRSRLLLMLLAWATLHTLLSALCVYRFFCDWGEREYLKKQSLHTISGLLPTASIQRLVAALMRTP